MDRFEFFNLFHRIDQTNYDLLTGGLKLKSFKKGEIIIAPGQIQKELYFVKSGIQMSYFDGENKTQIIAFTYFPNLCAIPESFNNQAPSKYFLSCLTESEMEYLTYSDLQKLFEQSHEIERLFRKMTEAILAGMINRHIELHTMTITERFKIFCQRSPQLLTLIPHKYIASYLGIDPTNFSKLYNQVRI